MSKPDLRGDIFTYLRAVVARSYALGRGVALSRAATARASNEIGRLRAEVEHLTRELDKALNSARDWEESAKVYAQNSDHYRERVERLQAAVDYLAEQQAMPDDGWRALLRPGDLPLLRPGDLPKKPTDDHPL